MEKTHIEEAATVQRQRSPVHSDQGDRSDTFGRSIYVRPIPEDADNESLLKMFEKYGPIRDVYVPLDFSSNKPRGFAYIEFVDSRDAEEAIRQCADLQLDGRHIVVELSKTSRKSRTEMLKTCYSSRRDHRRGPTDFYRSHRDDYRSHTYRRLPYRERPLDRNHGRDFDRDRDYRRERRSRSRTAREKRRRSRSRSIQSDQERVRRDENINDRERREYRR